jgi:hypothetical protein
MVPMRCGSARTLAFELAELIENLCMCSGVGGKPSEREGLEASSRKRNFFSFFCDAFFYKRT